MYLNILKKDLQRKRTMNIILLIFITLAVTFIASSVNNVVAVTTALDSYFEKANVPDYWVCTTEEKAADDIEDFVKAEGLEMYRQDLRQIDPTDITINGKNFDYSNTVTVSDINQTIRFFDADQNQITKVEDGEIYVTSEIFHRFDFKTGDKITIENGGISKTFTLKGSTKDALFASSMVGITRMLISENDYKALAGADDVIIGSIGIFTDDVEKLSDGLVTGGFSTVFSNPKSNIKLMYIMDMVIAAAILIVSICLILIALVILRFTIHFTMSEEYREIGVMKAIGIRSRKIRTLYLMKYFAISVVGGIIGFVISIYFQKMLIRQASQNIIIPDKGMYIINVLCAAAVAGIVLMFGYFCTKKINKFTPIDAIRNGEMGVRYKRKGLLRLSKTKLSVIPFMALNDIWSSFRRFGILIVIFTLGMLLVIIPLNTINTLQSDELVTVFSMAPCDHVISKELLLNSENKNRAHIEEQLKEIKEELKEEKIDAQVFMELMFRMNVSNGNRKSTSLAFQGLGDVTADAYTYLEGTPPENEHEVGLSHIISKRTGAKIGDTVQIDIGSEKRTYLVTALFQTMNNMGEGIRFHEDDELDYNYAAGSFGTQIRYTDKPDYEQLENRKEQLKEMFPDYKIYTAGEYISYMMGDVAGQLQGTKQLILAVVLFINVLVTVLMVKSFITREKGQIGMLKAIGFRNTKLRVWQTMRIGIVMLVSAAFGIALSTPLSKLSSGQVFKIMGSAKIEFDINPLETYLAYPAIIFAATITAAYITAAQVCKISASETSNIE